MTHCLQAICRYVNEQELKTLGRMDWLTKKPLAELAQLFFFFFWISYAFCNQVDICIFVNRFDIFSFFEHYYFYFEISSDVQAPEAVHNSAYRCYDCRETLNDKINQSIELLNKTGRPLRPCIISGTWNRSCFGIHKCIELCKVILYSENQLFSGTRQLQPC